ncbi:MAG: hypothetical protein AB1490_17720 [Pseudomonadota bacterium]
MTASLTRKSIAALGLASAIALMVAAPAYAQQMMTGPADTWSYTVNPGPNGQCWNQTDAPFSQRGFGYWGNCPASASATPVVHTGHHAYARAHKRMHPTHKTMSHQM